jgi:hypothetical protein
LSPNVAALGSRICYGEYTLYSIYSNDRHVGWLLRSSDTNSECKYLNDDWGQLQF